MSTERTNDQGAAWMLAYQAGDERAFDRLVEKYSGQLYALFTRFLGPIPEREDLVQEVFLRIVRNRERYEPSARFSTFLYRIAFNLAVNRTEREGSRDIRSIDRPSDGALDEDVAPRELVDTRVAAPSQALERDDVVGAVRTAIAELTPAQRMALILAKYEELPYEEIAVVMGTSEKAIKSMVHRARENLRVRLAPFLSEERL
ncbi:MAG: sigma-70 family RNA polymerase sigma factor [Planctomycetes bacterium]|nr:sigma-70 family RNA polymerase sigma factor [Planctomycetota bacterium]